MGAWASIIVILASEPISHVTVGHDFTISLRMTNNINPSTEASGSCDTPAPVSAGLHYQYSQGLTINSVTAAKGGVSESLSLTYAEDRDVKFTSTYTVSPGSVDHVTYTISVHVEDTITVAPSHTITALSATCRDVSDAIVVSQGGAVPQHFEDGVGCVAGAGSPASSLRSGLAPLYEWAAEVAA